MNPDSEPILRDKGIEGLPQQYITRVAARDGSRIRFIRVSDITYFSGSGNYVEVHQGERSSLIRESLTELEQKLPPNQFVRVSRTAIINLDFVEEMHTKGKRNIKICLKNGVQIKLNRKLDLF